MATRKRVAVEVGFSKRAVGGREDVRAARYKPSSSSQMKRRSTLNRRGVASRETGFVDVTFGGSAFDTTGTIALVNTIAAGTSVAQRVGKKVLLKSLQMRGIFTPNSATIVNGCCILVVYDKRPTGSLPNISEVLATTVSYGLTNDASSGRFQILRRITHDIIGNSNAIGNVTTQTQKSFDFYLDLKGKPLVCKALGTGAIGDIEEGALYVITIGQQAAGTGASALYAYARTRFVDI